MKQKYLEYLYEFINWNEDYDAVSCDYFIVDDEEKVLMKKMVEQTLQSCGIMFKMDKIIDLGLYNPDFLIHEDKELMIRFKKKYRINLKLPL